MQRSAANEPLLPAAAAAVPDTFWPCVANLSKVIIGAGMMAIPQAYCRIGSVAGTSMLVLVGCLTYTTLVFLLRGSATTGATTYSQLTQQLCGPAVTKVLQVAVLSFCFGFGVVYLVILRDILLGTPPDCNGLLCELFGLPVSSVLYDARLVIILLALLVCSPLLLFRSMDRLAVLNVVGVAAIGLLALTALGLGAHAVARGSAYPIPPWPQWTQLGRTAAEQWQAMAQVMPVVIACYVAHQSLHPLMPLLQPYSDARMRSVIAIALLIAFSVFTSLAVGSSLAFGPGLEVNVLNNYSVAGLQPLAGLVLARLLSWCIRGGYFLSLLASLLLYMHPLRACLAEIIWHRHPNITQHPNPVGLLSGFRPQAPQQYPGETTGLLTLPNPVSTLHRKQDSSDVVNGFGQQGAAGAAAGGVSGRPPTGASCFAAPAVQAAAVSAVGVPGRAGSSSGGSSSALDSRSSSSSSKQLSAFDSLDNPRTGSWSGVHYMADPGAVQPQQQTNPPDPGAGALGGGRRARAPQHSGAQQASRGLYPPPGLPPGQQQQQRQQHSVTVHMRDGVQIHVLENFSTPPARSAAAAARWTGQSVAQSAGAGLVPAAAAAGSWREAEQRWYYQLTYGLFGAMVLVAIAVPNIWTALSAIGDLSSTLQAFVVPGLIGLTLTRHAHKLSDGSSSSSTRQWLQGAGNAGVGALAVFLGAALFVNGIYQRL